jgi:hypothetical protein
MTLRAIGIVGVAFGVLAAGCINPARAATLTIDLSISYDSGAPGQLSGMAQFSLPGLSADVIDVGPLSPGQKFFDSFLFEPPDPCFALSSASCNASFSFSGLADGFSAFAFLEGSDIPGAAPSSAPIISITGFVPPDPCFATCNVFGPIVAFDSSTDVGEWDVTISQTPLPSALTLFATGISLMDGLAGAGSGRRRHQRVANPWLRLSHDGPAWARSFMTAIVRAYVS